MLNRNIYKTSLFVVLMAAMYVGNASAINVVNGSGWGYKGDTSYSGGDSPFLAGGTGKSDAAKGTYGDEWGGVIVIATKIVEHGGYFCPYQLQCNNARKGRWTYTTYYHPTGWGNGQCMWLCEEGYAGEGCAAMTAGACSYDDKTTTSRWGGLSMKRDGDSNNMVENEVFGLKQWGSDPECDVLVTAYKFFENGVVAAPMTFCCGRDNWKSNDSFIDTVGLSNGGTSKLLCASGYAPNAAKDGCEKMSADRCSIQGVKFCDHFPAAGYDSSMHTLSEKKTPCAKYFCPSGQAFTSASDTTCTECSTGVKGGSNSETGLCVKCETGEFFNTKTNSCDKATAYTTIELQYGKGKTKNDTTVKNQCWTIVAPEEYKACMTKK